MYRIEIYFPWWSSPVTEQYFKNILSQDGDQAGDFYWEWNGTEIYLHVMTCGQSRRHLLWIYYHQHAHARELIHNNKLVNELKQRGGKGEPTNQYGVNGAGNYTVFEKWEEEVPWQLAQANQPYPDLLVKTQVDILAQQGTVKISIQPKREYKKAWLYFYVTWNSMTWHFNDIQQQLIK